VCVEESRTRVHKTRRENARAAFRCPGPDDCAFFLTTYTTSCSGLCFLDHLTDALMVTLLALLLYQSAMLDWLPPLFGVLSHSSLHPSRRLTESAELGLTTQLSR
jgi:hypothetical protein